MIFNFGLFIFSSEFKTLFETEFKTHIFSFNLGGDVSAGYLWSWSQSRVNFLCPFSRPGTVFGFILQSEKAEGLMGPGQSQRGSG